MLVNILEFIPEKNQLLVNTVMNYLANRRV